MRGPTDNRYLHTQRSRWPEAHPQRREKTFLVPFACGHVFRFARPLPEPGAAQWCSRCRTDTRIAHPKKES